MSNTADIGLIYPPSDVRAIVDKTAEFVARNGDAFEARIAATNANNLKFAFLKKDDPYRAYYDFKVDQFKNGGGEEEEKKDDEEKEANEKVEINTTSEGKKDEEEEEEEVVERKAVQNAWAKCVDMDKIDVTKVPDAQEFNIEVPKGIPDMDRDIIKMTAQYTAASGRSFLSKIARREEHNPQFAFLKVTHVLFKYFTILVEHYTKILKPPTHVMTRLKIDSESKRRSILERCVHRLEYEREIENKKKIDEAEKQADRVAFQSIDWHDFVVVETIEFKDVAVTTTTTTEQGDVEEEEEEEDSDVDMDMDDDDDEDMEVDTKTIMDDDEEEEIEIRTQYKPQIQGSSIDAPKYFVDDKGQKLAVDQSAEIMRIQNLDPRWREQQLRAQAKTKQTALATSADLARNLARMARHREDIFGEKSKTEDAAVLADGTVPPPPPRKSDDGKPPTKRTRYN